MKTSYIDLIDQTFYFPQEEFGLDGDNLTFHGINLMGLIEKYGTPLKLTYLPRISENIQRAKNIFAEAMRKNDYRASYNYCYCTKSSHYSFVLHEALKNDIHIETSSAFDIPIVEKLIAGGYLAKDSYILCNGFKRGQYIDNIARLINTGHENTIPIIDNEDEIDYLSEVINDPFEIGIRIASEEEPKFTFYTSRLGIKYRDIAPLYRKVIKNHSKVRLKMLHFFINTGIKDSSYYWNELSKCLKVYADLKKDCPELDSLNIGGGFPIKNSLGFEYDYQYMADEIISQIKLMCDDREIPVPNIFTEFGTFTVGESGATIYQVMHQKEQNDRERWDMINSSFMTTMPDSWAINQRFVLLPVNRWKDPYERVLMGGLTCDSDDYYNSEQHVNAIYMPKFSEKKPLYIGFFNNGAYQDALGGVGGLQHCLIPQPQHIIVDKDKNGNFTDRIFRREQSADEFMKILGYSDTDNR